MKHTTLSLQALIVLSFIFLSVPVFAQVTSKALPDAGTAPGDAFYFLDRTTEEIQKAFTVNPVAKAELSNKLAEERLAEAVVLAEKGDTEKTQKAVDMYMKEYSTATAIAVDADGTVRITEEEKKKLQQELANNATRNLVVLDSVAQYVPATAYDISIVEAKTISKQAEVIAVIATDDPGLAKDIFDVAVKTNVREIQSKADDLSGVTNVSQLDSSIQDFNSYMKYGKEIGVQNTSDVDTSLNSVVNILSGVKDSTTTSLNSATSNATTASGTNNPASSNSSHSSNTRTSGGNNTAATSGAGAPAYQSNSAGLSWQEYILTR